MQTSEITLWHAIEKQQGKPTVNNLVEASAVGGVLGLLGATMIDISDPVVAGIGLTLFGCLSGAVKVLWDKNSTLSKTTEVALSKCEDEHKRSSENIASLTQQVIALSGEVGLMKGRIQGFQEASDKAEAAHLKEQSNGK